MLNIKQNHNTYSLTNIIHAIVLNYVIYTLVKTTRKVIASNGIITRIRTGQGDSNFGLSNVLDIKSMYRFNHYYVEYAKRSWIKGHHAAM